MLNIDMQAFSVINPELMSGERLLWAGRPSTDRLFHRRDWIRVPSSLFVGGFAILWAGMAMGWPGFPSEGRPGPWFFQVVGVLIILYSHFLMWGRFLLARWRKGRTFYAVTERRVITVQFFFGRRMAAALISALPMIVKDDVSAEGIGTLRFSPQPAWTSQRSALDYFDEVPASGTTLFLDIPDVEAVYHLVRGLMEKWNTQLFRQL
jgi:hypothetical protein